MRKRAWLHCFIGQSPSDKLGLQIPLSCAASIMDRRHTTSTRPNNTTGTVSAAEWEWICVLATLVLLSLCVTAAYIAWLGSDWIITYLSICSICSFVVFLADLVRTLRGEPRTFNDEITIFDYVGGWPGLLLGFGMFGFEGRGNQARSQFALVVYCWAFLVVAFWLKAFVGFLYAKGYESGMKHGLADASKGLTGPIG
ncbi:hypothetical protein BDZ85DRAFT_264335 [Elsinoe ampelina]|uniref:Uncharacterized protein n=1 Tax=Elsinoe ampelina TaxID=302913 RepID=A0A6A6G8P9_9PEZI|nr:hypothetical protein BDZ85DRAFT_264335 [Elsinoe ampelina]